MSDSKLTPSSAAHWRAIGQYTAAQAASLLLGMEPQGERISDTTGKDEALARRIAERFNLRDPGSLVVKRRGDPSPSKRTTISFADLERFAYANGLTDSPLFSKAAADDEPVESEIPDAPQLGRKAEPAMLKAQSYALALMLHRNVEQGDAIEQAVLTHYESANETVKNSKRATLKRRLNDQRKNVIESGEMPD